MEITTTSISELLVLEPKTHNDSRGYFMENFRAEWLPSVNFIQENESFSKKNVLRGLHYQKAPFAQAKLIRCVMGRILDVAVDLRKDSSTFGQHFKIELSGENKKQLFIPQGFAHGFLTLSDWAIISYKVDNYYNADADANLRFDDKTLNIDWGIATTTALLSEKDQAAPLFSELGFKETVC